MKKIIIGALALSLVAVLAGCSWPAIDQVKPTVKIGVTLPLTGNLSFLGENYRDAVNLALAEVNEEKNKYEYELIFEDDQFNPVNGVTNVNKLISVDKVDALISFGSPVGNAVSPIAEESKIVHINGIASDPAVAVGDYNFVHWTPPYKESRLMAQQLKEKGLNRVVIFEQNHAGAKVIADALRQDLADIGIEITGEHKFNGGEKDFRSIISKVKGVSADAYILLTPSPELELLTKQIKEAGISIPLTTIEGFEFTDQPAMFEGMWYVNAADQSQEFMDKFKGKYENYPKFGGGNGYDSLKLLVKAFEEAGKQGTKPAQELVIEELSAIKGFSGAMGELSVDENGMVITDAVVRIIKDGVPVTVQQLP